MKKVCPKCGNSKSLKDFYKNKTNKDGYSSYCICCKKEYREINKEKICKKNKEYRKRKRIEKNKFLYKKIECKEYNESYITNQISFFEENFDNNEFIRLNFLLGNNIEAKNMLYETSNYYTDGKWCRNKYEKIQKKRNPIFKLKCTLRTRLYLAFTTKKWSKDKKTEELLGTTFKIAHKHIEKQFSKGMRWDNHGDWHIDHMTPLASASTKEELINLCHYKNLQPLWAKENMIKSNKIVNYLTNC